MSSHIVRLISLASSMIVVLFLQLLDERAQSFSSLASKIEPIISTSGSFSIIPIDTWGAGDFDAFTDQLFGYNTPRVNQLAVSMDQTATTFYEGDLFFRKLRLKVGLNVDVDNNFIGKLNSLMGYINYSGFTLRVQTSELRGTAVWSGETQTGIPTQSSFDNSYISVDFLYYLPRGGIGYIGIGYTSYQLPVQLDCLTYNTSRGEVWWVEKPGQTTFYQPNMAFHIYSFLFGIDTLHDAFMKTGTLGQRDGFGIWMATQDRFGGGLSYISDWAKNWIETRDTPLTLWSATQIAMMVDYNLTLGVQWVGDAGPVRLGFGLGFNLGGQTVMCITPKGPVDSTHVDASPSVYLFHYGPILQGTVSW